MKSRAVKAATQESTYTEILSTEQTKKRDVLRFSRELGEALDDKTDN
jgi:hypothetical protein